MRFECCAMRVLQPLQILPLRKEATDSEVGKC